MKGARIIIITGMSGSGKSVASKSLEDKGFFCIDNLPVDLLPKLFELGAVGRGSEINKFGLVMDAREPSFPARAKDIFEQLRSQGYRLDIVFLDADDEVLQRRYSETRRSHPAAGDGSVVDGIRNERASLVPLREIADRVIDTSHLTPHELRQLITEAILGDKKTQMRVSLTSFGFKRGLPVDADLVMDVRFLPNPFFIDKLRPLTGKDKDVADYVLQNETAQKFVRHFLELLEFLIPHYRREGKSYLNIAIGCTGGHHRSVAIVEALAQQLGEQGLVVNVTHRDIVK